jgi:hypothetical protein
MYSKTGNTISPRQDEFIAIAKAKTDLTMEAEQVLLLLQSAGDLHYGDGEAVAGGSEHRRGQRHVLLLQELYRGDTVCNTLSVTDRVVGSLVVKSVGPVTERSLVLIPSRIGEQSVDVPLSKALKPYAFRVA